MRGEQFTVVPTGGAVGPADTDPTGERLLSIKETQERLAGVTRRHISNLVRAGHLRGKKLGSRVGIWESSVDAYIRSCDDLVTADA